MARLIEELHSIHHANALFWRESVPSCDRSVQHDRGQEYYRRLGRLEKIRSVLGELTGALNPLPDEAESNSGSPKA
jgi:hypothetical protein